MIHADIKPANLMANVKGDAIMMAAIDFGFSKILSPEQEVIQDKAKGSPLYCAPEIMELDYDEYGEPFRVKEVKKPASYSFASDVYALAVMFKNDFKLDLGEEFYQKAMHADPKQRYTTDEMIQALGESLQAEQRESLQAEQRQNLANQLKPYVDDLDTRYSSKRAEKGLGWLKKISSRRSDRAQQLLELKDDLKIFSENPNKENCDRLTETLERIEKDIDKETHFLGESGLKALIKEIQEKIEPPEPAQTLKDSKRPRQPG